MPTAKTSAKDIPVLSSNIFISNTYIHKNIIAGSGFRNELDNKLALKNPVWIQKSRFSSWQGWRKTTPEFLYYYTQTKDGYYLPRNYDGVEISHVKDCRVKGRKTNYGTSIEFRDYQAEYYKEHPEVLTDDDKVINVPCGGGKTILGIYNSSKYKVVTLILVPTHFLAEQWEDRIKETTTASYYVWKSTDKVIPDDRDFYICSFDLFTVRDLPEFFLTDVGHVILDEAHRLGAATYLPILDRLPAKRRTALTATFRRGDGMHQILHYHFGPVYKMNYTPPRPMFYKVLTGEKIGNVMTNKPSNKLLKSFVERYSADYYETKTTFAFTNKEDLLKSIPEFIKDNKLPPSTKEKLTIALNKSNKQSYTIYDNHSSEKLHRLFKTIAIIRRCLDSGRTILVLSKRKAALRYMYKHFKADRPLLIVSKSTDNMTEEQRVYMNKKCRLIFGISQLAKEGLDVDRLDTLVYHTQIKDTEQPQGRINRLHPDKKKPLALYLEDDNKLSKSLSMACMKYVKINSVPGPTLKWFEIKSIL